MNKQIQAQIQFNLMLLFFAVLLGLSQPASALRCEQLFTQDSTSTPVKKQTLTDVRTFPKRFKYNLSQFMNRFKPQKIPKKMVQHLFGSVKNLMADATGKRVEYKVTADTEIVEKAMSLYEKKLTEKGITLSLRNEETPGKYNVTYTEYTQPFEVTLRELKEAGFEIREDYLNKLDKEVIIKIRIRSYGTVDNTKTEFGISDIEFAKFTNDRSFVELKFEDPSYEGAVFKPQAYMNDNFIKLFNKPAFLDNIHKINTETLEHLEISPKKTLDSSSVKSMLEFLTEAHKNNLNLSIVAKNFYRRQAKSTTFKYNYKNDPEHDSKYGNEETVTVEMTFDQLIALQIPGSEGLLGEAKYYRAYGETQTVSEFKTPTRIAHHLQRASIAAKRLRGAEGHGLVVTASHAKLLDQILPGLKEYFEMIDEIIQARDASKGLNRGKWGTALNKVRSDIIKILEDSKILH